MCGLFISHKFKVHISGGVPYITKCGHHGHLAVTLNAFHRFKSSFRELISNLAKDGTFTVYWVIHDIMPRTGT